MSRHALPAEHPQRVRLNDEVHARPPVALWPHERVLVLAQFGTGGAREREDACLAALLAHFGLPAPEAAGAQLTVTLQEGASRLLLKVERHTEFTTWWLFERAVADTPFGHTPAARLPAGWLESLPGELLVAVGVALDAAESPLDAAEAAARFAGHTLIGALPADGGAQAFGDFRIGADGISRFWMRNFSMGSRQAGRMVQRLVEIETYRMAALLALPAARGLLPELGRAEDELSELAATLSATAVEGGLEADRQLLARLSRLAARIEALTAAHGSRFSAAQAYGELVLRRIGELREQRMQGVQTVGEFMDRRLVPALRTIEGTARRLELLSARIGRASELLRARVEVELESQNGALLASMDRRARLQLRLQATVEGLSTVAISYYGVGLLAYGYKALEKSGLPLDAGLATGLSVPAVVLLTLLGIRRLRRHLREG